MSNTDAENQEEELFGTATVVARTGLTAARVRMWEKRYGAIEPQRTTTKRRLYTRDDLERLSLLRLLTDSGHAIGRIANYPSDRLRKLASEEAELTPVAPATAAGGDSVLVVSEAGEALLGDRDNVDFEWTAPFANLDDALESPAIPGAGVLLLETDTLFAETIEAARKLAARAGAGRSIIAYRFATRDVEQMVGSDDADVVLLHGQKDPARLRRECVFQLKSLSGGPGLPGGVSIPKRRYDANQLGQLANIVSAVDCECPRHMAELLKSLNAFESYSEACEDRNNDDAMVHAFLHRTTAQVRRTMEDALSHLLKAEGISLK